MSLNQFPRRAFSGAATLQTFTGNGSTTTFTLSQAQTQNECFVYVDDVAQVPVTDYGINGTTLTFTSAPANNAEIIVRGFGVSAPLNTVSDGAVTSAKLANGAIEAKLGYTPASAATVASQLATLVDSAPTTLDTLNELAAALGDDPNYATTITTALGTKANQATTYTKTEVDNSLALKANSSDVTSALALKADASSVTNASNLTSGTLSNARLPTGAVVQIVQSVKRDAFSMGTSDWTTISNFSGTITPTRSSSNILLQIMIGRHDAGSNGLAFRILRNGSVIEGALGDGAGSRDRAIVGHMGEGDNNHTRSMPTIVYLDSPATTSAVTYSLQVKTEGNSTYFFNRSQNDTDISNAYGARCISTITMTEVV